MSNRTARSIEPSELYQVVLSFEARNRARFGVILQALARILCHLEERERAEVLAELEHLVDQALAESSDELKAALRRPRAEAKPED